LKIIFTVNGLGNAILIYLFNKKVINRKKNVQNFNYNDIAERLNL